MKRKSNLRGDGTQGVFEGYASVFSHQDSDGDIILPGAFKHVLDKQKTKSRYVL
ncbi:head maturation protease [Proteus mirabilis]|uniref:Head maturation protease n=1 Tax=Proteus mirabilis TaxID=584 RepID=A0A379FFG8_PROMI|nr:head maturation protease [Proteus mirabilis]